MEGIAKATTDIAAVRFARQLQIPTGDYVRGFCGSPPIIIGESAVVASANSVGAGI